MPSSFNASASPVLLYLRLPSFILILFCICSLLFEHHAVIEYQTTTICRKIASSKNERDDLNINGNRVIIENNDNIAELSANHERSEKSYYYMFKNRLILLSGFQIDILPFQEWEMKQITHPNNSRICTPPQSIPMACCLGSTSKFGGVGYTPSVCNYTLHTHQRVANYTIGYLKHRHSVFYNHQTNNTTTANELFNYTNNDRSRENLSMKQRSPINCAHSNNNTNKQQFQRMEQHQNGNKDILRSTSISYNNSVIMNHPEDLPKQDCDICRIIDYLMIYNWTLSFQGDSITGQAFQGLICELHRRGIYSIAQTSKSKMKKPWKYGILSQETLMISYKNTTTETTTAIHNNMATIRFYKVYRPDNDDVRNIIIPNTDLLVFDYGIHYEPTSQASEFQESLFQLLKNLKQKKVPSNSSTTDSGVTDDNDFNHTLKMIAWRHTSAQHFNSSGGYYSKMQHQRGGKLYQNGCVPILKENNTDDSVTDEEEYYLSAMKIAANRTNFKFLNAVDPKFPTLRRQKNTFDVAASGYVDELIFLPYHEYTSKLHYFHPVNDCTHYCHDPVIWIPIWSTLRIAIDRTVRLYNIEEET